MNYNQRFPEIWQILTQHIDFTGKTLLDIGCGYGDLIKAAYQDGATVYGLDRDFPNELKAIHYPDRFYLIRDDINWWTDNDYPFKRGKNKNSRIDILTCFSVLPYLKNMLETLSYFKQIAPMVVIECQYYGDGPGLLFIQNDEDMRRVLDSYWPVVSKIGQTFVDGRNKYRSIWLCE